MKKSKFFLGLAFSVLVFFTLSCGNNEVEKQSEATDITDDTNVTTEESVEVEDTEYVRDLVGEKIIEIDETLVVSQMSGRYDYKVIQKENKHYLVWKDKAGVVQSVFLGDRTGLYTDETKSNTTVISRIDQTENSDIVNTVYTYSGAITANINNQVYVNPSHVVVTNIGTNSHIESTSDEVKVYGAKYLYDRVALLDDNIVKIYNDKTGELIQEIDGRCLYGDRLNSIYEFEDSGLIYNIQAVALDFVVVNMLQPNIFAKDDVEKSVSEWYYTTVINLETLEMYPVYEQFNCFKEGLVWNDGEMMRPHVGAGFVPSDKINFVKIDGDGKLVFESNYVLDGQPKSETVAIAYN